MTKRTLPPMLAPHAAFLRRAEAYFGLPPGRVTYEMADNVPDIASIPALARVLIGRRWRRAGHAEQQKRLTHELAHIGAGLPHDDHSRSIGYYSNPARDRWSRAVYADILAGTRRFDPVRFGVMEASALPRRNPLPLSPILSAVAAGAGAAVGSHFASRYLPKEAPPMPRTTRRRNPSIQEGELVRIPTLGVTGTVVDMTEEGGGLLSPPRRLYQVEYETAGGKRQRSLIPESGLRRLNPRRSNAAACPVCRHTIRVQHGTLEVRCPECRSKLRVER